MACVSIVSIGVLLTYVIILGRCPRGDKCSGIHDIHRTAICQSVLRGITCSAGDDCDLTHESSSQVAPTSAALLHTWGIAKQAQPVLSAICANALTIAAGPDVDPNIVPCRILTAPVR